MTTPIDDFGVVVQVIKIFYPKKQQAKLKPKVLKLNTFSSKNILRKINKDIKIKNDKLWTKFSLFAKKT